MVIAPPSADLFRVSLLHESVSKVCCVSTATLSHRGSVHLEWLNRVCMTRSWAFWKFDGLRFQSAYSSQKIGAGVSPSRPLTGFLLVVCCQSQGTVSLHPNVSFISFPRSLLATEGSTCPGEVSFLQIWQLPAILLGKSCSSSALTL